MTITAMNHFTILTDDVEATRDFYGVFFKDPNGALVELDFAAHETLPPESA